MTREVVAFRGFHGSQGPPEANTQRTTKRTKEKKKLNPDWRPVDFREN